jgi:hypothetical protein
MMAVALWTLGVSAASFLIWALMTGIEIRRQERLLLARARGVADRFVTACNRQVQAIVVYVVRHVITLSWYYSIHSFLKVVLQFLAYTYNRIESVLLRNRDKVRQIRKERRMAVKNHLTVIAEHKAETTLTAREQKKLKDKTLEGR